MEINWHGKPGSYNKGHEIEYGTAPGEAYNRTEPPGSCFYFSVCGHRKDDERFRVWVYYTGTQHWRDNYTTHYEECKHLGDGFDSAGDAKAFAHQWMNEFAAGGKSLSELTALDPLSALKCEP